MAAVTRAARSRALLLLPRASAAAPHFSTTASSGAAAAAAAPVEAAAAGASDASAAAAAGAGEQPAPPPKRWGLLKFGAFAAVCGALGAAGYSSYAYTLEEVDQKTREFRKAMTTPRPVAEDASEFEKFQAMVYSTAMKAPVAAIEFYMDVRHTIEDHIRGFAEPTSDKLLPDLDPLNQHIFTLVLDLNETLVYSDWLRERGWRTFKRPGVDAFIEHMGKFYEVVVYSDQMPMYVDPVLERLDTKGFITGRLSRPATKYQDGKHYRDLSKLNRNPAQVIYISGHALESCLQPENCVQIKPWKLETDDTQLLDLIPFLEYVAMVRPSDIRTVLASYQGRDVAAEFIERSKEHQRRMQEQKQHGRIWRR
ncbi:mitochondrial import inner membrane translocase subunit TIM50-like [Oryza glaberrima]|uniref:Mitochondrial import inner membrane translocase subunit TIM50 n=3 Tax=Oryza TaxID=4527 RepID=A0A0D3G9P8_9ORYZ|nr:mitochondrial import inner membrane translocase subunit TIM50-like [Oryza glaberrima]